MNAFSPPIKVFFRISQCIYLHFLKKEEIHRRYQYFAVTSPLSVIVCMVEHHLNCKITLSDSANCTLSHIPNLLLYLGGYVLNKLPHQQFPRFNMIIFDINFLLEWRRKEKTSSSVEIQSNQIWTCFQFLLFCENCLYFNHHHQQHTVPLKESDPQ